eukprot:11912415-Alexandrium_andersonii.AAC.1
MLTTPAGGMAAHRQSGCRARRGQLGVLVHVGVEQLRPPESLLRRSARAERKRGGTAETSAMASRRCGNALLKI